MNERQEAHAAAVLQMGTQHSGSGGAATLPCENQIVQGDSIQLLNTGPEGWVDLVFADPPFNIGYLYHGYDDRRKMDDYLTFTEDWMRAVHRALKPSGSFYLAIGDDYAADLCVIARRKIGFHLRNWIVWHYTFGQQTKMKFARSHTHIFYFTKDEKEFTFNADAVRVASARQTTYKDLRANPKGKLPDDVWYLRPQEAAEAGFFQAEGDTWNVSRVCGTFKEREGWHGCQMPIGVLNRIVTASSNPGDIVLDPFNGSGTTAMAAALLGRKYVGIDQSEQYVAFARQRLASVLDAVKRAPLGVPLSLEEAAPSSEDACGGARAASEQTSLVSGSLQAIHDHQRPSRVRTKTDAFGRPRVDRGRRKHEASAHE